jgi:hypothetical protein
LLILHEIKYDQNATFRSLAPTSAALRLFDASNKLALAGVNTIRVPFVGSLPPQPVLVEEGQARASRAVHLCSGAQGP